MKLPIYQIDAFTDVPFRGNPAAVCPLEDWLADEVLQAIAEENNLAETSFYLKKGDSYEIRWFTPVAEVDLCGHATLAAAHVLFASNELSEPRVTFQSRSGPLHVTKEGDLLTLNFPAQVAEPCAMPEGIAEALGAQPSSFYRAMDYLVTFESEEEIAGLDPDFRLLSTLDLRGVIATAPGTEVDFVSRFFAPKLGVDEDPVTGSAHCTLAPYWADRLEKDSMKARQLSKRTGEVLCRVEGDRVFLSGNAVAYLEGMIEVYG
ncbi:MAG: PhzF family phenazine biosynthesis protein [Verrucomicrobiota bacterium]